MTLAADAPAPASQVPNGVVLYFGLLAPPLAWTLQENICFGLASHACFPRKMPLANFLPDFSGVWTVLISLNTALLCVAAVGVVTSFLAWRTLHRYAETRSDAHRDFLDTGENRMRVFAASGLLVSWLFVIAIGVNTISLMTLSTCSQA